MSTTSFLQEMPATVVWFDVRRFSRMAASLGPTDLAVALGSFYRHVEHEVEDHDGKVVKFISDGALTLFLSLGGVDHAGQALRLLEDLLERSAGWSAELANLGLPEMTYSVGVASGMVLNGELGTDKLRAFDVLGRPVTLAVKLAGLATMRDLPHLVAGSTIDVAQEAPGCIEVEGAEFADEPVRLFRVLARGEQTGTGKD